jgi:hypothetical protein
MISYPIAENRPRPPAIRIPTGRFSIKVACSSSRTAAARTIFRKTNPYLALELGNERMSLRGADSCSAFGDVLCGSSSDKQVPQDQPTKQRDKSCYASSVPSVRPEVDIEQQIVDICGGFEHAHPIPQIAISLQRRGRNPHAL